MGTMCQHGSPCGRVGLCPECQEEAWEHFEGIESEFWADLEAVSEYDAEMSRRSALTVEEAEELAANAQCRPLGSAS